MWHVIQEHGGPKRFVKCLAGMAYFTDGGVVHCTICAESEEGCDCVACNAASADAEEGGDV